MAAWAAVAHSSGSGWVQALGVGGGRRAGHRHGGPRRAGDTGHRRLRGVPCPTPWPASQSTWSSRPAVPSGSDRPPPGSGHDGRRWLLGCPTRRPLHPARTTRRPRPHRGRGGHVRPLRDPLVGTGPRRAAPPAAPRRPPSGRTVAGRHRRPSSVTKGSASPVPAGLGDPRGVRPYTSGDPRRSVHWPATAHVGALMVRETERTVEDPVVIDVVLPTDGPRPRPSASGPWGTGAPGSSAAAP